MSSRKSVAVAVEQNSEQSSQTREDILRSALKILRDEGHAALTVRHVAATAGCSTIGVYTWFGGKDGLVDAILLDGFERFAAALRSARSSRGPLGGLVGQGRAYRSWALAHRTSYEVMFMGAVPGHQPSEAAQLAGLVAYQILRDEVVAAQARGAIAHSGVAADAIAMAMWGLVHGLVSIEIARVEPTVLRAAASLHRRSFDVALRAMECGLATTVS